MVYLMRTREWKWLTLQVQVLVGWWCWKCKWWFYIIIWSWHLRSLVRHFTCTCLGLSLLMGLINGLYANVAADAAYSKGGWFHERSLNKWVEICFMFWHVFKKLSAKTKRGRKLPGQNFIQLFCWKCCWSTSHTSVDLT